MVPIEILRALSNDLIAVGVLCSNRTEARGADGYAIEFVSHVLPSASVIGRMEVLERLSGAAAHALSVEVLHVLPLQFAAVGKALGSGHVDRHPRQCYASDAVFQVVAGAFPFLRFVGRLQLEGAHDLIARTSGVLPIEILALFASQFLARRLSLDCFGSGARVRAAAAASEPGVGAGLRGGARAVVRDAAAQVSSIEAALGFLLKGLPFIRYTDRCDSADRRPVALAIDVVLARSLIISKSRALIVPRAAQLHALAITGGLEDVSIARRPRTEDGSACNFALLAAISLLAVRGADLVAAIGLWVATDFIAV